MTIQRVIEKALFLVLLGLFSGGFSATSSAQAVEPDFQILTQQGDQVAGVGLVTTINHVAVDNDGNTMIQVDTDNPDYDLDHAVLRNGVLYVQEGEATVQPAGVTVDEFDSLNINTSLNTAWNLDLDGTGSANTDGGIYYNKNLLIQLGDASTATVFDPANYFIYFWETKINNTDDFLAIASVVDPSVPAYVDWAIILMDVDAGGNLLSETVILREYWTMPGQVHPVRNLGIRHSEWAFNDLNQLMFTADEEGDPSTNSAVYLDGTLLAREGNASPVPGRLWYGLSGAEVDCNNVGGWVIHAELDGSSDDDFLIEKSGQKLVQEGDTLPGMSGYPLLHFGFGPVFISDTDNVLWYGRWHDPDTSKDAGLFLNDQLIVQEGVTTINGEVIEFVHGGEKSYTMSRDGDWVLFEVNMPGSVNTAVMMHVGPWTYLSDGLAGTNGITPRLRCRGSLAGGTMAHLDLTHALPNTSAAIAIGFSEVSAPFKGGIMVPFPDIVLVGLPVNSDGELTISFEVPAGLPAGVSMWAQYWPTDPATPRGFSASNAVKGTTP